MADSTIEWTDEWDALRALIDDLPDGVTVKMYSEVAYDPLVLAPRVERNCDCDTPGPECPTRIRWVDRRGLDPTRWPVGTYNVGTRAPERNGFSHLLVDYDGTEQDERDGVDTVQWAATSMNGPVSTQARAALWFIRHEIDQMLEHARRVRIRDRRTIEQREVAERVAAFARGLRQVSDEDADAIADVAVGDVEQDAREVVHG